MILSIHIGIAIQRNTDTIYRYGFHISIYRVPKSNTSRHETESGCETESRTMVSKNSLLLRSMVYTSVNCMRTILYSIAGTVACTLLVDSESSWKMIL